MTVFELQPIINKNLKQTFKTLKIFINLIDVISFVKIEYLKTFGLNLHLSFLWECPAILNPDSAGTDVGHIIFAFTASLNNKVSSVLYFIQKEANPSYT